MPPIYLDHNATTPVDPGVVDAMLPYLSGKGFANASSSHAAGREARQGVERARERVAALVGAQPDEILFTSGGTEADNLAVRGLVRRLSRRLPYHQMHMVTSPVEHDAVLEPLGLLRRHGVNVWTLPVDRHGRITPAHLDRLLRGIRQRGGVVILVTIMLANNEVGNLYPIRELADVAHAHGVPMHTDAVQAVGKIPVDVDALGVDLLSVSAHKFYGPKGVGALYMRRGMGPVLGRILYGGSQEGGLRCGTYNTSGIVGMGEAARLARGRLTEGRRVETLRDRLQSLLLQVPGARVHGDILPGSRLPGTLNMGFSEVNGWALAKELDRHGVAVSRGPACSAGRPQASHVLRAMGWTERQGREAVRFSLGRGNTEGEVIRAADAVSMAVRRLRDFATL